MSTDVNAMFNAGLIEVVLRDLESLLRKSIGEQVEVVSFTTTSLLPLGENYASSILKVDAVIKKTKDAPEENLALVAKMTPATVMQKSFINLTGCFTKEIFIFEKLINAYKKIEENAGINPENVIDILPKFYGGRLSIKNPDTGEADDDVVLLMENLKARDYYMCDRVNGLDLEHAKLAIKELARFHALGIAVKTKMPDLFEEAKKYTAQAPYNISNMSMIEDMFKLTAQAIFEDPRIAPYKDRLLLAMMNQSFESMLNVEVVEPWVTVSHGDFWANNIMFYKENDKVKDVKFIDFQLSQVCSPLRDLPYFIFTSTCIDVVDNHIDELLDVYYENFIKVLKYVDCDNSPFSKDNFEKQLNKDFRDSLCRCIMALRTFTAQMPQDMDMNDIQKNFMNMGVSPIFIERTWKTISKFVEKQWL